MEGSGRDVTGGWGKGWDKPGWGKPGWGKGWDKPGWGKPGWGKGWDKPG